MLPKVLGSSRHAGYGSSFSGQLHADMNWEVLYIGVLLVAALLFGIYIGPLDFLETPAVLQGELCLLWRCSNQNPCCLQLKTSFAGFVCRLQYGERLEKRIGCRREEDWKSGVEETPSKYRGSNFASTIFLFLAAWMTWRSS